MKANQELGSRNSCVAVRVFNEWRKKFGEGSSLASSIPCE